MYGHTNDQTTETWSLRYEVKTIKVVPCFFVKVSFSLAVSIYIHLYKYIYYIYIYIYIFKWQKITSKKANLRKQNKQLVKPKAKHHPTLTSDKSAYGEVLHIIAGISSTTFRKAKISEDIKIIE